MELHVKHHVVLFVRVGGKLCCWSKVGARVILHMVTNSMLPGQMTDNTRSMTIEQLLLIMHKDV